MSKHTEEFLVPLSEQEAEFAVKDAVASCGWGVKSQEPGRLVPRIGIGITRMPSSIEVLMRSDGASTTVTLNGKISGLGPLQKRHITAEVGKLRNAIDVAAHRAAES
jgi:hypothetical protein